MASYLPLLVFIAAATLCSASTALPNVGIPEPVVAPPRDPGNYHPERLLVTLHNPPPVHECHSSALPEGLDLHHLIDNSHAGDAHKHAAPHSDDIIFVAQITNGLDAADMLETIRDHPEVKHVELDAYMYSHKAAAVTAATAPKIHPNDVFYECNGVGDCGTPTKYIPGQQWGLNVIGAPAAWKYTTGSKAVKVGIIDTGVSVKHQDLKANTQQKCADFVNNDGSCDEGSIAGSSKGHGTHAAGIIGGTGNNNIGVVGVNWHSTLVGCTMFPDNCAGDTCQGSTSAAIKCLNWLRNSEGVRIISNSYGCKTSDTPSCYSKMFERSIQAFNQQGGLFVVSAGNDGVNNDKVAHYPANYKSPNVLTVAATSITKNGVFWDINNPEYVPVWSDYGMSVDMAAPGGDMISTWAPASTICQGSQDCYARISGTSAAAPMVAGAAALIASMPGAPSGAALKALILKHADPLAILKGKVKSGRRLNVFGPVYELATKGNVGTKPAQRTAPASGPVIVTRKTPPTPAKVSTPVAKPAVRVSAAAVKKKSASKQNNHSPAYWKMVAAQLAKARQQAAAAKSSKGRRRMLSL